MSAADFPSLPPELAEPEPGADEWVEQLAETLGAAPDGTAVPTDELPERAQRFRVDDERKAEWAMRHVVRAQAELDRLAFQASEWQDRIAAWFDHAAKPLRATVAFMSAHLERYALELREADPKRKSVTLPSGVVKTTATSPRVVVTDEDRARAWAGQHAQDALVPQEPKLLVSLLRQHVRPVQLVTEARATLSCGCTPLVPEPDFFGLPDVGTEVECESHGPVLLGRVDVLATRWVPHCVEDGTVAEGVDVDPGGVTAKVVPAP